MSDQSALRSYCRRHALEHRLTEPDGTFTLDAYELAREASLVVSLDEMTTQAAAAWAEQYATDNAEELLSGFEG